MTRRPGIAAIAGLVGLGVMAAGLADRVPESLRACGALAVLLVLPVFLCARHVRPFTARAAHPGLRVSLALALWISALALWTGGFALARAPFHAYATATTWLLIAGYGAAALRSMKPGPVQDPGPRLARRWWILIVACALFAAVIPHRFTVGEDSLDHIGYVRRIISEDTLRPAGVLAMPVDAAPLASDPRKGTLHAMLALASSIASADPLVVFRWLSTLLFPATVLAALAFNAAFVSSRTARLVAGALLLFTFQGNLFRFAGASAHGESIAAMWCWVLTAAIMPGSGSRGVVWALLAAGGVLVHLGVVVHVAVLAATIAWGGRWWGIAARERLQTCAALAAGVALALALRYPDLSGAVNIIHGHTQGVLFVTGRWFVVSPMELLRLHGMLFLGGLACIPLLVVAARASRDARAILVAAAIPFFIAFTPWVATALFERGSYMAFRSLLNVPAFAAIALCGAGIATGVRRRDRRALWLGIPVAAIWLWVFFRPVPRSLVYDVRARVAASAGGEEIAPSLIAAVAALPAGSVVLSDPATSYVLSAYTSQRFVAVYQQHANPRDPDALDRIRAVRDVMSPYVLPDVAVEACRRFGVNYVVVNSAPPRDATPFLSVWRARTYPIARQKMESMGATFARIDEVGGASIYRFDPRTIVNRSWDTQDRPVRVAKISLAPCPLYAPDDAFRVTGVSLSPARALPGDTVQVTVGYVHDGSTSFDLPVVIHARFDHEELNAARAYPGEKLWRRMADGRMGSRSRFRADLEPGHGVYEPDIWPVGFDLCETFAVVVPESARLGTYRLEISVARESLVPNFHLRDIFYNRDQYSGAACGSLMVSNRTAGAGS